MATQAARPTEPGVAFVPYSDELLGEVRAFNARLDAGGGDPHFRLREGPDMEPAADTGLRVERFYAVERGVIRGGVFLQHQPFWVDGQPAEVVNVQLPLSEGIVNRAYAYLGMWLLKQVLRRHPRAFLLGMGGVERPLPQMLKAMLWDVHPVPFYFRVLDVASAMAELPMIGTPRRRRLLGRVARATGAGVLADAAWRAYGAVRARGAPPLTARPVTAWGPWADEVWEAARDQSQLMAVRDSKTLRGIYPDDDPRVRSYALLDAGRPLGWVALSVRAMRDSAYFGNLRVGTLIDGLCAPGLEVAATRAAVLLLRESGAQLVVANHSQAQWRLALAQTGFAATRSNYALATSPALRRSVPSLASGLDEAHFTRGDGDGRVHL